MSAAVGRKTACVTGGGGYVASELIKVLLERGYAVKTTVRDPDNVEKKSHLKDLQTLGPLEIIHADELDEEASFDNAVSGCDVFLVTAPTNLGSANPEKDLIEAAVHETLNVTRSCVIAGTVKRVVLTWSDAAVSRRPLHGGGHLLDEGSWSDVEYLRSNKPPTWGYAVSKEGGERICGGESPCCPCTPWVRRPTPRRIPASLLSGDETQLDILLGLQAVTDDSMAICHVDDLCRANVFVAENESSAGRYI